MSQCGPNQTDKLGLRTGAIFVVLVTSLVGTLFPVITKRHKRLRRLVPGWFFEFGKFFGSGVILATALMHLLAEAAEILGPGNSVKNGGCVADSWGDYPYPLALCLTSLYLTFIGELFAIRFGKSYLAKKGIKPETINAHSPSEVLTHPSHPTLVPPSQLGSGTPISSLGGDLREQERLGLGLGNRSDRSNRPNVINGSSGTLVKPDEASDTYFNDSSEQSPPGAQILGVAILEFGILFHSLIIGMTLTLSAPADFVTLFIVIVFHQMFEGLGLGTRLAFLQLPPSYSWAPWFGAILYSIITPLGMAIGLGTRESVSMSSATVSVVSGILDAISAGILLYAGTVELIAHEFIFSTYYHTCSLRRLIFVLTCFATGAALMSLLGKWA